MIELHGQIKPQRLYGQLNVVPVEGTTGGPLQAKTAYPSHSEQIIAPDEDYYGLVSVTVKPVPRLPTCEIKVVQLLNDVRYLNHKALAEIPAEALAEYPYAVLLVSTDGSMWLWLSTEKMYVATNEEGIDRLSIPANRVYYGFNAAANAWMIQYAYTTNGGYSINGFASWAVWWANHDIHIGSADSGEIYFPASQPQEVQPADAEFFYYNGERLPKIPVVEGYPYAFMEKLPTRYYIVFSTEKYYYNESSTYYYPVSGASARNYAITFEELEAGGTWVLKSETAYTQSGPFLWANYDIPKGSATATTINNYGTPAVPDPLQGGV